jgi:hypothetical protein
MAEPNTIDESERLDTLDKQGNWQYPSAAAEGRVEVELPALPGSPNAAERLHVADFGRHIIGQIEKSMNRQPYMKSGPQQNPVEVFQHYTAVAKGATLLDAGTLSRMEAISKEFEREPEQEEYFNQVLRPYLLSLTPKRR